MKTTNRFISNLFTSNVCLKTFFVVTMAYMLSYNSLLEAQTVPNAALLMNNIEQGIHRKTTNSNSVSEQNTYPPEMVLKQDMSVSYVFNKIQISGSNLIDAAELTQITRDYADVDVNILQLNELRKRIEKLYREQSIDAWAYIPQQDLFSGKLIIQVIERKVDPNK
jgi:hemolysin activation/secretion protein